MRDPDGHRRTTSDPPPDKLVNVSRDHPPARMRARRWLAVLYVLIAAAGITAAWRIHVHTQPCWAVRQLIDFNRTAQDELKAKHISRRPVPSASLECPPTPTTAHGLTACSSTPIV